MSILKNLTMTTVVAAKKEYVDTWDGKAEVSSRHTETRIPYSKDPQGTPIKKYNIIKIRHRNDDKRKVLDLVASEQKKDPRAVTVVNGVLWSRADVELQYKILQVDQLVQDKVDAEALIRETEETAEPAKA